jgi:hypothetical protein
LVEDYEIGVLLKSSNSYCEKYGDIACEQALGRYMLDLQVIYIMLNCVLGKYLCHSSEKFFGESLL